MKKLIAGLVLVLGSSNVFAEDRFLHYEYSPVTYITLTNIKCPFAELKEEFKYASYATNTLNGFRIFGCFRETEYEMVRLQWHEGDFSEFPANAFLLSQPPAHLKEMLEGAIKPKATL